MRKPEQVLAEATSGGVISASQRERLLAMFAESPAGAGELDRPTDNEPYQPEELSEAPRFVRGFHDVLITIGVVAALAGLWGVAPIRIGLADGAVGVLIATIVLAEFLVRRQKLALPAFALTVAYAISAAAIIIPLANSALEQRGEAATGSLVFLLLPVILAPFYWRYRVPVALAAIIAMVFVFFFMFGAALMDANRDGGQDVLAAGGPWLGLLALSCAVALFTVAMSFDLRDRNRVTRRSDVAFWLHLVTAPALLYAGFSVTLGWQGGFWWSREPGIYEAVVAVALVAVMMGIGILIDRRAFVTAGLISLGAAIYTLVWKAGLEFSSLSAFAILAVGVIVLMLGTGWRQLRRAFLARLPNGLRQRLPPAA